MVNAAYGIWFGRQPCRIKLFFAWRLATDSLAVTSSLHRSIPRILPTCAVCGVDDEDAHHCMVRCTLARALRDGMRTVWSLPSETELRGMASGGNNIALQPLTRGSYVFFGGHSERPPSVRRDANLAHIWARCPQTDTPSPSSHFPHFPHALHPPPCPEGFRRKRPPRHSPPPAPPLSVPAASAPLSVPESSGAPSPKWQEELVRRRKLSDRRPDPSAASGHFRDHLHPRKLAAGLDSAADDRPDELVSASADSASGLLHPVELVCRASRGLPARGAQFF
ncbi:hypothetical protein QYE76_038055 [Lolium multiflorum]|uniref:Reverse transcriptase zinc-binding domain-containing protein n=1 Tax=Lolium multiflorum TaxID=4521 RepID=A0AAD8WQK2_LOLMU|nr:hypothetical protein QYE76_038055 [Lolium multiflorum]